MTFPFKPTLNSAGMYEAEVYSQEYPTKAKGVRKSEEIQWEANLQYKKTVTAPTMAECWKKAKSEFVAPVLQFL